MKKRTVFREGKAKKFYEADVDKQLIQEFRDDAVTDTGKIKGSVKNKGTINNQISCHLFRLLDSYHISTHFIKQLSAKEMLVKKIDMIPLEVFVRNVAVGSLVKRFGIEEGKELECPVIEYYLKNEKRDEAMINKDHIVSFGYASSQELREIHRLASKINVVLIAFFRRRNVKLVDLKLEFGRYHDKIMLGEGIDLETCRLIDLESDKKWYRDQMSMNVGNLEKIYEEFNRRFL